MKSGKKRKKKEKYLTVYVKPSDKLKHTITVSIPRAYYFNTDVAEIVRIAIEHTHAMAAQQKQ